MASQLDVPLPRQHHRPLVAVHGQEHGRHVDVLRAVHRRAEVRLPLELLLQGMALLALWDKSRRCVDLLEANATAVIENVLLCTPR